jgi:exodeoxyribonuclease VII large subunit
MAARRLPSDLVARLATQTVARCHADAVRLGALAARLHALDPLAVLKRGYAVAFAADGSAITDVAQLHAGDSLTVQFSRGAAGVQVQTLLPSGLGGDEQD